MRKKLHIFYTIFLFSLCNIAVFGQTTLYSTTFGTSGSLPSGWTATGTYPPTLSSSYASSGYTGASGSYNVLFTDDGTGYKYLTYSNTFSTVGYTDITVLWGGRRNSSSSPNISLYWSTDGSTWNGPVSHTQPSSSAVWGLVNSGTRIALPSGAEGVANLRLRWQVNITTSSSTVTYRLDDVSIEGTLGAVANDNCSGAIALTVNSTCNYTSGTSAGATQSIAGCSGNADDDVWFSFVALASTATITVDPSTTYDAAFELRSGACNGTQVAGSCKDAGGDNVTETYNASGLTIGNTYYIRVWDYGAGSGSSTFDICVYSPITPCTSPTAINGCGSSYAQSFSSNGSSTWSPDVCGYSVTGQETVYSFVAPSTGSYNIVVTAVSGGGYVDYAYKTTCSQTSWTCISYVYTPTTLSSISLTAGNTYYFLVVDEDGTASSNTFYISCPASAGANISLSNNGTQVATANIGKGTVNQILHKFSLAVTGANATLTGLQCTTAGTYASADITNLKVRYSTDATLDAADATLSTITTIGTAGTKTFTSFSSQLINTGTTGYIFITVDIAAGATTNNTIRVSAVTTSQLTFSSGTKTGSTTNGGYQTIVTAVTAAIALADNGTVAAANVKQGTSNHVLIKVSLAVTLNDATLTGMTATTAGTYVSADVTHLKVWYSDDNTLDEFDEVLSTYSTPGAAGAKTFPSFVQKTITSGTTGYIFITAYIAPAATTTKTVKINALATTDFTFVSGTKSGSSTAGGSQTITALTRANDDISGAITISNTNYLPQAAGTWSTQSNASATISDEPSAPDAWTTAPATTVWFKFTATTTAQSISTNYYNAVADTRLAVYSSSDNTYHGELTLIGENEDVLLDPGGGMPMGGDYDYLYYGSGAPFTYHLAAVTVTGLTVGNVYFVMVDGSTTGNFRIATNTAPANDACETATDMQLNTTVAVNTTGATIWSNMNQPDAAFDISGTASQENLVFFKFRAPYTDTYYINQGTATCIGVPSGTDGTQFLVFSADITCDNMPTLLTGYNTGAQQYSSNTTTAARAISQSFTAGSIYYMAVDGGRGDECTFNFTVTRRFPLPIELQNFNLKCSSNPTEVTLTWTTATEVNNDFFTVTRSTDGNNYSVIGTVPGVGNSSVTRKYSFTDKDPMAGTSYYQLTQTDYNGQSEIFAPLAVHCSEEGGFSVNVNGNLIDDKNIYLTVNGAADKKVIVVMTDIFGREVFSTMLIENADSYLYTLKPTSEIASGLYYITASSENKYMSKKIVIK